MEVYLVLWGQLIDIAASLLRKMGACKVQCTLLSSTYTVTLLHVYVPVARKTINYNKTPKMFRIRKHAAQQVMKLLEGLLAMF